MAIESTTIIAIYGAVLSSALLIWKVVTYYLENTSRLKVEVKKSLMITNLGDNQSQISVEISNIGKKPVTVSSGRFVMRKGINDLHFLSLELPKKIEEGENHSIHINIDGIKSELKKQAPEIPEYVEVTDQTGKEYKSKGLDPSIIKLLN